MAVNPDNKYKSSHVGSVIDEAIGYALNIPDIQNDVASLEAKVAPLNGVPAQLQAHISDTDNPHSVTKEQVGLGNVNNTSDADKPISSATQTALDKKVDKVTGMGLSQNSYTTAEKNKLSGVESGAEVNVIESVKVNGVSLPVSSKAVNVDLSAYATKASVDDVDSALNDTITQIKDGDIVAGQATSANLASTAQTAAQLSASRTISLNGDVTASVSFNGTTNVSDTVDTSKIIQSITVSNTETCASVINKVISKYKSTGSNLFSFNTGGIYSGLGIYLQTDNSIYFIGDGDGSPYAGYIHNRSTQWGTAIEQLGVLYSQPLDGIPLTDLAQNVQNLITGAGDTQAIVYGTCVSAGSTLQKTITLSDAPTDWGQPFKYIFAIKYTNSNTTVNAKAAISGTTYEYRRGGSFIDTSSLFVAGRTETIAYYYMDADKTLNWLGDTSATQAQFTNEQVSALVNVPSYSGFTSNVSAGGNTWSITKIGYPNDSTARTFAIATMTGYDSFSPTDETTYNITLPIAFKTTYANCFLSSYGTWKNWEQVGAYQLRLTSSTNAQLTLYTNGGGTKYFKITVMGTI